MSPVRATLLLLTTCSGLAMAGGVPGDLQLNPLGVGTTAPLAARHAGDGSNRLFIADRSGTISIYDVASGQLLAQNFLDISGLVDTTFEGGLLGLAFHPDYASNGYFYLNYTRTGAGGNPLTTVIARYRVSPGNPNLADAAFGSRALAGVGVAFYVMAALYRELERRGLLPADAAGRPRNRDPPP